MRAKKSLGQNFLMHQRIADRIADAANIPTDATVLEIGPGTGLLTRALLARSKKVVAVEADGELVEVLKETFHDELSKGKLELLHQDIRTFDPSSLSGDYHIVANIPYYITGELFRQFLTAKKKPLSMTLLVQKEVAVRAARSKKESLLSLSIKVFGEPHYEFTVPRGAFRPAPSVDSAVLSIRNIQKNAFNSEREEERFFEILRAGFAHRRKLLAGNLSVISTSDTVKRALEASNISLSARAEDIPINSWRTLATLLAP